MFLLTLSPLLSLLPLLQNAPAAAAAPPNPSTNNTTISTTAADPLTAAPRTPNFSLGPKIPLPSQPDFPLLTMLFLTCEGLFTFAPFAYTAAAPSGSKSSGTLRIRVEGNADLPGSAFQVRHVMWAFWLGAVTQLDARDYRPGIFVMDVVRGGGSSSSSGGAVRSVGSIIYSNDNPPDGVTGVVGNGTASGGGGGGGGIEPFVVGAGGASGGGGGGGVDVTSRRRRRRRRRGDGASSSNMLKAAAAADRFAPTAAAANTTTTTTGVVVVSFPGFNTTTTTTTTSPGAPATTPQNTGFYNILITSTSPQRLSFASVFTTVFETMVARASLPDREFLRTEWLHTSSAGYTIGIAPPVGSPPPPFEAMMGGLANLPRALQSGRYYCEVTFDVVDGESGVVVLQGVLGLEEDGGGEEGGDEVEGA